MSGLPAEQLRLAKSAMASLRPEQRTVAAEAFVQLDGAQLPWGGPWPTPLNAALLAGLHGEADSVALLQNPAGRPEALQGLQGWLGRHGWWLVRCGPSASEGRCG
jgi:hypothetical protein